MVSAPVTRPLFQSRELGELHAGLSGRVAPAPRTRTRAAHGHLALRCAWRRDRANTEARVPTGIRGGSMHVRARPWPGVVVALLLQASVTPAAAEPVLAAAGPSLVGG